MISITVSDPAHLPDVLERVNGMSDVKITVGAHGPAAATHRVIPIREAVEELLRVKAACGLRPTYLVGLRQYLMLFCKGREEQPLHSFTEHTIEEWLTARKEGPGIRAANLGRLGSLFSYARRKRWISESPVGFVEHHRIETKPPRILSIEEARKALTWTVKNKPRCVPWLCLGLFAGIRPMEVQRLDWPSVDLDRGIVTVDASASKVRHRRIVPLEPNCVAWLKAHRSGSVCLPHVTKRRYQRRLRKVMGWTRWPQDILRHTAASYLIARYQDAGKVARSLGNSAGILLRHYVELAPKEQAEEFFSIVP